MHLIVLQSLSIIFIFAPSLTKIVENIIAYKSGSLFDLEPRLQINPPVNISSQIFC
jgi:hypothetical protein